MKLYLAYGSNMWEEQMNKRCPDHLYFGHGILKGYRWIITTRGYANIVKSDADEVHGVVYKVSEEDELRLDEHEGVSEGLYFKEVVPVTIDKTHYECFVYVDPIETEDKPAEEYVARINNGISDAELSPEYVEKYIRKYIPLR